MKFQKEFISRVFRKILRTKNEIFDLFYAIVYLIFSRNSESPRIVLVSQGGHGRVLKLAKSLNSKNIYPVLITGNASYFGDCSFEKVMLSSSHINAFRIASQYYKGSIFHVVCNWDYIFAALMIFFKVGKVYIDTLDVLDFYVKPTIRKRYLKQIVLEKWCLTRAKGLVCRDLRTNLLKKNGWTLPRRILFMDYINRPIKAGVAKELGKSIVYLGNVELEPSNDVAYQYGLAEVLCAKKIRFDFYPSYQSIVDELRSMFRRFAPTAYQSNYLFVHNTIPVSDLPDAISTSSYGLLISSKTIGYDGHDTYYPITSRYFFAGKVFDYYESGVFPITQKALFVGFVMKRMGVGVMVDSYEDIINFILNNQGRSVYFKYNDSLTLEYNASRLVEFYKIS